MDHLRVISTPATVQWFGWTDRGKVRPNNEDAFLGLQFDAREVHHLGQHGDPSTRHTYFPVAVSDGMGGADAGEFASRIAVEKITTLLPRSYQQSARGLEAGVGEGFGRLFCLIQCAVACAVRV